MRPSARVQAAIEILAPILDDRRPADRSLDQYFRTRRYAGAKDRRAVAEFVYGVLRGRGLLEWRLAACGAAPPGGRQLVLSFLVRQGTGDAEITESFTGPFAAAPLGEEDWQLVAALRGVSEEAAPDWARLNYSPWLDAELRRSLSTDIERELVPMAARAAVDLRVNTLALPRTEVLSILARDGVAARPTPFSPVGIRLNERARISEHDLYRRGAIEIQDEGSQLVALLCRAAAGMTIIDLCAGAGGKSLAIAAAMGGQGEVIAIDADARRLGMLTRRAVRGEIAIIRSRVMDATAVAAEPNLGPADVVLVDAPCSGSGTWRRQPEAGWNLTAGRLDELCAVQDRLLDRAAGLVRGGGRLVFATCSLLRCEGADRVERFLGAHPGWVEDPVAPAWRSLGLGDCPLADGPHLRLSPARSGTDGFFLAILQPPTDGAR